MGKGTVILLSLGILIFSGCKTTGDFIKQPKPQLKIYLLDTIRGGESAEHIISLFGEPHVVRKESGKGTVNHLGITARQDKLYWFYLDDNNYIYIHLEAWSEDLSKEGEYKVENKKAGNLANENNFNKLEKRLLDIEVRLNESES